MTPIFSITPSKNNALIAASFFRNSIKEQFINELIEIQNVIQIDLGFLINKLSCLDETKKISPIFFVAQSKISLAIESESTDSIFDALQFFKNISTEELNNATLTVSSILSENWEHDFVNNELRNGNAAKAHSESLSVRPIVTDSYQWLEEEINDTINLIKDVDEEMYQEIITYLTRIKLFNGNILVGATSPKVFGAMYLRTPENFNQMSEYFCEHIVHEVSHLHLDSLLSYDKLVLNNKEDKYPAPIRSDLRPMLGIFHATFVLSRIIRIFEGIVSIHKLSNFESCIPDLKKKFNKGVRTIEMHGHLSINGQKILAELQEVRS